MRCKIVTMSGNGRVQIDKMANARSNPVRNRSTDHSGIRMSDQNDVIQLIVRDDPYNVLDVGCEGSRTEMSTFAQATERGCVGDNVFSFLEMGRHATPAPSPMPCPVNENDVQCFHRKNLPINPL